MFHRRLVRLRDPGRVVGARARRPERAHGPLPRDLDASHAPPRGPDGRHADHGGAAERNRLLRLDLADRDRRHAQQWEAKTIGLVIIFAYAFFKFAWSYRLYNYVAILLGAMPFSADKETPEALAHI